MILRHRTPAPLFDRSFDRAFEQLTSSFFDTTPRATTSARQVHGEWVDGEFVLTVDLPGVPAEAVTVDVSGSTLELGAHTDHLDWTTSLRLGSRLDPDKVTARHLDGRLTVRIGTYDEPEARRIEIDTTPMPEAIEATSNDSDEADEAVES